MKLEHVTIDDRLRSYLKSNFANRNTLVIWPLSMCDSEAEVETIKSRSLRNSVIFRRRAIAAMDSGL